MAEAITLEEVLKLVSFCKNHNNEWCVYDVNGVVQGDVKNTVWGDVVGTVQGDVKGNVIGEVKGRVWGHVGGSRKMP